MHSLKLRLDITCLTSRQRRRIFLKKFHNICQMTVNSNNLGNNCENNLENNLEVQNNLEVTNDIISESNGPSNIEQQLPQQLNVLREIDFDDFNLRDTHKFTENNDNLISTHSGVSTDQSSNFQSNISSISSGFSNETKLINDIRIWVTENNISHSAVNNLLKILVKHGHNLPTDARTLLQTPKKVDNIEMTPGKYYHVGLDNSLKKS